MQQLMREENLLPLATLTTFVLNCILLFRIAYNTNFLYQLTRTNPPELVQLQEGQAVRAEANPYDERTAQTIRYFVNNSLTILLTWSVNYPPPDILRDAQFLLVEESQTATIAKLSEATIPEAFTEGVGNVETALVLQRIELPEPVEPGKWSVNVIGHFLIFEGDNEIGRVLPFNQKLLVTVAALPDEALPMNSPPLQKAVYSLENAGLAIEDIESICLPGVENAPGCP